MKPSVIQKIHAREVLDSRGNPTVEAEVWLEDGSHGMAIVPSGASTGAHEAREMRDGDARYHGRGVRTAVENVKTALSEAVVGVDAVDIRSVDATLGGRDGTPSLGKLGANAVLAVSMASIHAAAQHLKVPLWRFVADLVKETTPRLPVPMLNVLNGGEHANNGLDVQEIMLVPSGFETFADSLRAGAEIYQSLKGLIDAEGHSTAVGDEGGFAPRVDSNAAAIELVARATEKAGYTLGDQVTLALDVAATEFHSKETGYTFEGQVRTVEEMVDVYAGWCDRFPIVSIEDGLAEDDWKGWKVLTAKLGEKVQLVGDDLFVTRPSRLQKGILEEVANAVLVKPNQIGTISVTFDTVLEAQRKGYGTVMSHRSGDTEDTTIADLAVGLGTGQIKTGAPCRAERTAKYNQLLRIEERSGLSFGLAP